MIFRSFQWLARRPTCSNLNFNFTLGEYDWCLLHEPHFRHPGMDGGCVRLISSICVFRFIEIFVQANVDYYKIWERDARMGGRWLFDYRNYVIVIAKLINSMHSCVDIFAQSVIVKSKYRV